LQTNTPEGVVLAILADFGNDQPETVIRQILYNLNSLIGKEDRLIKYQKQLRVLSQLRNLSEIIFKEIQAMPFHYEKETDAYYLAGIEDGIEKGVEKGIEKGVEKGINQNRTQVIMRMLEQKKYTLSEIVLITGATEEAVLDIAKKMGIDIK
jgi:flagellar biosynthesis/type III secretory pathway protein FliH